MSPIPRLRARDAELVVIGERLAVARRGGGSIVFVEGHGGFGKTRVLAEAAAMAGRLGVRVGSAAADSKDQVVPMGVLLAALFDGSPPLLDRGALRALGMGAEQRYWLLQELETLLERAALAVPLLICLDDMQWADGASVAALRALPSRLASLPIVWLVAYRATEATVDLRSAIGGLEPLGTETLRLERLDEVAVAQVVADVVGAKPDSGLLRIAQRAGGSPFLLVELALGLLEEELVRVESGHAALLADRLPARVRDSMRARLQRMSAPARQVARVASVLGRNFSFDSLCAMLDATPATLLGPVDDLLRSGLLSEDHGGLAFRHDLIREAVLDTLPASTRRALQRQAVEVLLAAGASPVDVALQLSESAEPGDHAAIETLLAATRALGAWDPGAAADLGHRALQLTRLGDPLHAVLVSETAVLLHEAGRVAEGKAFADAALSAVLRPEQEAEVRLSIAGMLSLSPDVRAQAGRRALELPGLSDSLRARHLALLFHNLVVAGRPREAAELAQETESAARSTGDANANFAFVLARAGLAYSDDQFELTLKQIETSIPLGRAANDEARERLAEQWHSNSLEVLDRFDDALRVGAEGRAAAQRSGRAWALRQCDKWRARQLFQAGRLSDAAAVLEELFVIEEREQVLNTIDAAALLTLGRVALHTGDTRQTETCETKARAMLETSVPEVRRQASWLLALAAMARKQPMAARERLAALGEDVSGTSILPIFPMDVTDPAQLARIAVGASDEELARTAVAVAEHRASLNPAVASIAGTAAHALGLVHRDERQLGNAVEILGTSPRPLAHASALEDLGRLLLEREKRAEGIESLGQALERYASTGATWDAARVRGRLRSLGVRRRLVTPTRPDSGWPGLTQAELAVVRIVAQGVTNREVAERLFVSPHTVSTHLRHAFAKLGVNSRVELARLASEHRSRPGPAE